MKKRYLIGVGGVLVLAVLAVVLDPTYVLRGRLTNERFFHGRPTSYWRKAIKRGNHDFELRFYGQKEFSKVAFDSHSGQLVSPGPDADPAAVPLLIELLDDQDGQVCYWACNAVAILGSNAWGAVPSLTKLLRHEDIFRRRNAAKALAAVGPAARAA